MAETTHDPLITDEDARAAALATDYSAITVRSMLAVLEAVAPGLRARWVAEALDNIADDETYEAVIDDQVADLLRTLGTEYRDGTR